jgi:hypothetical protein
VNASSEVFAGLPTYSDRLRAAFEPLPALPDAETLAHLQAEAGAFLQTVLALEEHNSPRTEEESENNVEFQRLERKLDLILELLSARLADDPTMPERALTVCAAGLRWKTEGGIPAPGRIGLARVHLHRMLPRALCLPAEVVADEPGWLRLRFLPLSEECEERLLRHVFQQHRRQLAGSRRQRSGG